jgi:hypothetical protein
LLTTRHSSNVFSMAELNVCHLVGMFWIELLYRKPPLFRHSLKTCFYCFKCTFHYIHFFNAHFRKAKILKKQNELVIMPRTGKISNLRIKSYTHGTLLFSVNQLFVY